MTAICHAVHTPLPWFEVVSDWRLRRTPHTPVILRQGV